MEDRTPDKIAVFDTLFTTKQIQMYKILFSYLPTPLQKNFAMYIKFSELLYTIRFFQDTPGRTFCLGETNIFNTSSHSAQPDISSLCEEIMPYMTSAEQAKIQQIKGMMQSMKSMQEMMGMMEMMKDMFPEGMGGFGNMSDILNGDGLGTVGGFDFSMLSGVMEMMQAATHPTDTGPATDADPKENTPP
ncbi:MAG: hypothetical protein II994_05420 [Lachnospiraceae bacterium]|nr:hypothetical protein [Lachnospiraceae bacterium]